MTKLMKFEKEMLNFYRRSLISFDECYSRVFGYLICMADNGLISRDRIGEEINLFFRGME